MVSSRRTRWTGMGYTYTTMEIITREGTERDKGTGRGRCFMRTGM